MALWSPHMYVLIMAMTIRSEGENVAFYMTYLGFSMPFFRISYRLNGAD